MKRTYNARTPAKRTKQQTTNKRVAKYGVPRTIKTFNNQAFPATLQNKVKYCDIKRMSFTGGFATERISANGLFDPDISIGGHQPMYFDQLMTIYNHYTVLKSKITCRSIGRGGNATPFACCFTIVVDDDNTLTIPTPAYPMERKDARWTEWSGGGEMFLQNWFDAAKTFGRGVMSNDNLRGNSSSNPLEQSVYHLIAFDPNLSDVDAVDLAFEVEYDVVWSELASISSS